jgi:hypothetical protein
MSFQSYKYCVNNHIISYLWLVNISITELPILSKEIEI